MSSKILVLTGSIGLAIATLPEIVHIINKPESILGESPSFLVIKLAFTFIILVGLFISKNKDYYTKIIMWLMVWYTCYFLIMITYYISESKK